MVFLSKINISSIIPYVREHPIRSLSAVACAAVPCFGCLIGCIAYREYKESIGTIRYFHKFDPNTNSCSYSRLRERNFKLTNIKHLAEPKEKLEEWNLGQRIKEQIMRAIDISNNNLSLRENINTSSYKRTEILVTPEEEDKLKTVANFNPDQLPLLLSHDKTPALQVVLDTLELALIDIPDNFTTEDGPIDDFFQKTQAKSLDTEAIIQRLDFAYLIGAKDALKRWEVIFAKLDCANEANFAALWTVANQYNLGYFGGYLLVKALANRELIEYLGDKQTPKNLTTLFINSEKSDESFKTKLNSQVVKFKRLKEIISFPNTLKVNSSQVRAQYFVWIREDQEQIEQQKASVCWSKLSTIITFYNNPQVATLPDSFFRLASLNHGPSLSTLAIFATITTLGLLLSGYSLVYLLDQSKYLPANKT